MHTADLVRQLPIKQAIAEVAIGRHVVVDCAVQLTVDC